MKLHIFTINFSHEYHKFTNYVVKFIYQHNIHTSHHTK